MTTHLRDIPLTGAPPPPQEVRLSWSFGPYAATALVEGWLEIAEEVQDFYASRLRQDMALQHRLLHCTDPGTLFAVQAEFVQTAIAGYRGHFDRLTALGQRMMAPAAA